MKMPNISLGLYRHFKGDYFYVKEFVKDCTSDEVFASYFNILHPEFGTFIRSLSDFMSDGSNEEVSIIDRLDNRTGQKYRFQKVVSLDNEVKNISTESLINELRKRKDSPLQKLDIEGLSDLVFCTDYIVGDKHYETKDYPRGVSTNASFTTEEEAKRYFETHKTLKDKTFVFKRTFIEVD